MNKAELRAEFKSRRSTLSAEEVETQSQRILDHLLAGLDLSGISIVHIFLPIAKFNEPRTDLWIDHLQKTHPHIRFCIPKTDFKTGRTVSFFFDSDLRTIESKWGTSEPVDGNLCDHKNIDLVITPLLAFDKIGNRVGYGKGVYDGFFASCTTEVLKVGVSYFSPVDQIDDVYERDVKLDVCVTPAELIRF